MADEIQLAKDIKRKLKELRDIREPRESTWDDIIDFILPGLETLLLNDVDKPGDRVGGKRYDGTGVSALQLFADGLFGYLISPSLAWLKFTMRDFLMEVPEVRVWLQSLEEHFYGIFNTTNFYETMSTLFEYAPAMGFADIFCEEDIAEGRIAFSIFHPGELFIAENKFGIVDTVIRDLKMDARTAVDKFGADNVTKAVQDSAKKDNEFKKYDFIHAVFPRSDRDAALIDSQNKPFASVWMQPTTDGNSTEADGHIVSESGFDLNPHHVWRFKKGTTAYGYGPAEDALVEVLGANQVQKDLLMAAEQSVKPAHNVPAELHGKVDIRPGGMNYFIDPNKVVTPVSQGIDFPVGIDREERLQAAIERHFKVEFFTLLSNLSLQQGQSRTATEVIELQGEKAAVLGRPINRLNHEVLDPIIDKIFMIELRAGRLPPPPDILADFVGENVTPKYQGPLAQAQRKLFSLQGISQGLSQVAPLVEMFGEEALDPIDVTVTVSEILEATGFPAKATRDSDAILERREQRAQQQAKLEAQQSMMGLSEVAGNFAKADSDSDGAISNAFGPEEGDVVAPGG